MLSLIILVLQGFRTPEEVATFGKLLSGMADIVVHKYNGSLKVLLHLQRAVHISSAPPYTSYGRTLLCFFAHSAARCYYRYSCSSVDNDCTS